MLNGNVIHINSLRSGSVRLSLFWLVCCDSYPKSFSALSSIRSGRSLFRMDLINKVFLIMYRLQIKGIFTRFIWVPAHVDVK